jgi:hypothetical protein
MNAHRQQGSLQPDCHPLIFAHLKPLGLEGGGRLADCRPHMRATRRHPRSPRWRRCSYGYLQKSATHALLNLRLVVPALRLFTVELCRHAFAATVTLPEALYSRPRPDGVTDARRDLGEPEVLAKHRDLPDHPKRYWGAFPISFEQTGRCLLSILRKLRQTLPCMPPAYGPLLTERLQSHTSQGASQLDQSTGHASHDGSFDKLAIIVETRMLDDMIPLILHFSYVLGPTWQVIWFTKQEAYIEPRSAAWERAVQQGFVKVSWLPADTKMHNWADVSWFWTRNWIWEQVQSARRVLTFQPDSIICSRSTLTVDDFLEWDYIGAPVSPFLGGLGFNGGLSIRNPKMMLDILNGPNNNFQELWEEGHAVGKPDVFVEDRFFYEHVRDTPGSRLPNADEAKKFSVETTWYEWPVGYHAPRLWNHDRMGEIWKYCPEVELIVPDNRTLESVNKKLLGGAEDLMADD